MQTALLCAFANPPSSSVHDEIRALKSNENVKAFCKKHWLYFIVDQMNALYLEDINMDTVVNKRKEVVQEFLDNLTFDQY
jgi:hypothetical protein